MDLNDCFLVPLNHDLVAREDQPFLVANVDDVFASLRAISAFSDSIESLKNKSYEVYIPNEIRKKLLSGQADWDRYEDGMHGALIRDKKSGRIIKHIKVKELPWKFWDIVKNYEQQVILDQISDRLHAIEEGIKSILKGQQNDRLALIASGRELLRQSEGVYGEMLKVQLQAQGLAHLEEARQKVVKELEELVKHFGEAETKHQIIRQIKSHLDPVFKPKKEKAEEFLKLAEFIISSSVLIYTFYFHKREYQAAKNSLIPFESLFDKLMTVTPEIERLLPFNKSCPEDDLFTKKIPDLIDRMKEDTPIMLPYGELDEKV